MVQAIEKTRSLPELARLIQESHASVLEEQRAIIVGVSNCLNAKRQVGEYLLQAKFQVRHGQWLAWLRENCPTVEERTAQNYMLIAKEWDSLDEKLKSVNQNENISDLGVVKALRLIKGIDEVVDAELVEDEDESAIVPDRTSERRQEEQTEEIYNYKPYVGDIAKVIGPKASKFYGLHVKVIEIQNDVIVVFETLDKGKKSCLLSQQLELVERAKDNEKNNQEEALSHTNSNSPVSKIGNGTRGYSTTNRTNRKNFSNAQATLQHILNAITLPDDLARDILQQLVDYVNLPDSLRNEAMELLEGA